MRINYSKKNLIIICLAILSVLLYLLGKGYIDCYSIFFSEASDISAEAKDFLNQYYSSKYHIWHTAFTGSYGILISFILSFCLNQIYSKRYYNDEDFNYVYRSGIKKYFFKGIIDSVVVSTLVIIVPLFVFWLLLNLPLFSNAINVIGDEMVSTVMAPTIEVFDEYAYHLAITSPNSYVYLCFGNFYMVLISYSFFAFAMGTLLRNKTMRVFIPPIIIIIADTIIGSVFDVNGSIYSNALSGRFLNSFGINCVFSLCMIAVAFILCLLHLKNRTNG